MKKYYLRHSLRSYKTAYFVAILYTLGVIAFIAVISHSTTAPWWTLIAPTLLIPIGVALHLRRDTFYYIDAKSYLLYAGNDYGRKPHIVCKFTDILEVTYLPHTKEVKLTKPGGTDYLKLVEGRDFVIKITELFERIYPEDGEHTNEDRGTISSENITPTKKKLRDESNTTPMSLS